MPEALGPAPQARQGPGLPAVNSGLSPSPPSLPMRQARHPGQGPGGLEQGGVEQRPPSGLGSSQDGSAGVAGPALPEGAAHPKFYPVLEALCVPALCSALVDGSCAGPSRACAASGDRTGQEPGLGLGAGQHITRFMYTRGWPRAPPPPSHDITRLPTWLTGCSAIRSMAKFSFTCNKTDRSAHTDTYQPLTLPRNSSVDHPPQACTALPAKTLCTFSFKHQCRSS